MNKAPYCNTYTASSLAEFHSVLSGIANLSCERNQMPASSLQPLWYRGHERMDYTLLPNIYRKNADDITEKPYSTMHLREEYRYHHFQSRAYHRINTEPHSRIDWQEIMQHYYMKTRLMDWTESAYTALTFSLEAFLDPRDNIGLMERRRLETPTIWVINPIMLNKHVYNAILLKETDAGGDHFPLIERAFEGMDEIVCEDVYNEISGSITRYFDPDNGEKTSSVINGLVSLPVIDAMRQANASQLQAMLKRFEFNPFFYLLLRYYGDGVYTTCKEALPPLATLHPYHSERIREQHGAFTVFPYYKMEDDDKEYMKMGLDPRAMEYQDTLRNCLYEVRLVHAECIAKELLAIGNRRSSLYPELENYGLEIEAQNYHT